MLESNEKNFLLRVKTTKERTIQALDKDIITLSKEESRVERLEEEARQTGNLNKFEKLSKLKLKIIDQRIKIQSAKVNLICIPTADIIINEKETLA